MRGAAKEDVALRQLVAAALVYGALLPFDFLPIVAGRSVAFFASLLLLTAWVQYLATARRPGVFSKRVVGAALLLVVWAGATLFWSPNFNGSLLSWASLMLQLLNALALATALPYCWRRLVKWYLAGMTVLAIVVLVQPSNIERGERASVGGVDENTLAMVVCMGLAVAVYQVAFQQQRSARFLALAQICLLVPAVVHIGSRTGVGTIVVIVLTACLIALLNSKRGTVKIVLLSSAVVVAGYFALQAALDAQLLPERIALFLEAPEVTDNSRRWILESFRRTMDDWELFGVGYGADADYLEATGYGYHNAHHLLWRSWIETGFVGVILLGALLLSAAQGALRAPWRNLALILWAPILTFAVTLGGDRTSQFWLIVAFGAGQSMQPREPAMSPPAGARPAKRSNR